MSTYLRYLGGLPKSIIFNFRYFPLSVAWRLPVLLSWQVRLKKLGGHVTLPEHGLRTGLIKIGFSDVGIFDRRRSWCVWQVSGRVIFRGRADIGHGSKLSVAGELELGDGFGINAESAIICRKNIRFGPSCLLSWDVLIMDTDFHALHDRQSGQQLNEDRPVLIGERVWIGCRSTILKGVKLASGTVVAAGSQVVASQMKENTVIGGRPAKVLKEEVIWQ